MKKFTKQEMYEALKYMITTGALPEDVPTDSVITFCNNELGLLAKRAERAKETAAKKKAEKDILTEEVYYVLSTNEFMPISEIVTAVDMEDVTVAKVTYRLKVLVDTGRVEKQEISIPTENGKARKVMGYRAI